MLAAGNNIDSVNLALLIMRVGLGVVMIAHGYRHIFGGGKIQGTAGWFGSLGMKPPLVHAWLASLTELGAGASLILGFLTPLGAAGVVGTMLVALITNHLRNGFFIFYKGEGYEYVMTLTLMGLAMSALGAGEWSVDNAIDLGWSHKTGLMIGGAGVLGALLLLATCWRPPKREPQA